MESVKLALFWHLVGTLFGRNHDTIVVSGNKEPVRSGRKCRRLSYWI